MDNVPCEQNGPRAWITNARASLDGLFVDPWFTSLWTLQEAFLCRRAYLMPLESSPTNPNVERHFTLDSLCSICASIGRVCDNEYRIVDAQLKTIYAGRKGEDSSQSFERLSLHWKYLWEIRLMMSQRGLLALATRNPMALYGVAQYRRTRNDQDRMYGIQQVFGLSLGASAPNYTGSKLKFDRFVLEDQLGSGILAKYPVASQLHVFREPVEEGRGWRPSPSSAIPAFSILSNIWDLDLKSRCELSTRNVKGQRWGQFRGRACSFEHMSRICREVNEDPLVNYRLGLHSPQQLTLDTFLNAKQLKIGTEATVCDDPDVIRAAFWGDKLDVPRGQQQHRLAELLVRWTHEWLGGGTLNILSLGSFVDEAVSAEPCGISDEYNVGMVLIRMTTDSLEYWKRLGICIWQYAYGAWAISDPEPKHSRFLRADSDSPDWEEISGIFG